MTKWQEFPIRPQGRPWVGLNTRSGKLDDGSGQMVESSVNCIINQGDKLAKRKGLIRGLDERFAGAVCGLHKYTDECGREWLVVADEGGFSVRQPFAIPSFTSSDAYPSDSFTDDGEVSTYFWRNTEDYEQAGGALVLKSGIKFPESMVWFMDASNFSYELALDFTIDEESTVVASIKQGAVARIELRVAVSLGSSTALLVWVDANGAETQLKLGSIGASRAGSLVLRYSRDVGSERFLVQADVNPDGLDAFRLEDFTTLNALDDADLGQGSAVRLESFDGLSSGSILQVQGGPI